MGTLSRSLFLHGDRIRRQVSAGLGVALLLLPVAGADTFTFVPLAGSPDEPGYVDGTAERAKFSHPRSLAVDAARNVYVTESNRHAIRRITPDGNVSTWAGSTQVEGGVDGEPNVARFSSPAGLAADRQGNLYVADTGNHVVRKISPAGHVTTLAGVSGTPGRADGVGPLARFTRLSGIKVDVGGTVYVVDDGTRIRKITPGGVVTTLDEVPGAGESAVDMTVDDAGNILVLVSDPNLFEPPKIFMQPPGGEWVLFSNALFGPPNGSMTLYGTSGLEVDRTGTVYVATYGGILRVTEASPAGQFVSPGTPASALTLDADGNLYLACTANHTIIKGIRSPPLTETPEYIFTTLAGLAFDRDVVDGIGSGARFYRPGEIAVDRKGNVYVADSNTVRRISPDATVRTLAGSPRVSGDTSIGNVDGPGAAASFRNINGLAVDSIGNVYVTETYYRHSIRRISADGNVDTFAGSDLVPGRADGPPANARFNNPRGLAIDADDNLYVADMGNLSIRKISPDGTVSTIADLKDLPRPVLDSRFSSSVPLIGPENVTVDHRGNLYVADVTFIYDGEIDGDWHVSTWRIDTGGEVARWPPSTRTDSPPEPNPVPGGVDSENHLYLADRQTIVRVTTAGRADIIGGVSGSFSAADGLARSARFHHARRLTLDHEDNIYISDAGSSTIRKGVRIRSGTPASRLGIISVRASLPAGQPAVTELKVKGSRLLLLRAIGPGIRPFMPPNIGVANDPRLELFSQGTLVHSNETWGGSELLSHAFVSAGAFPLPRESTDAVLLETAAGEIVAYTRVREAGVGLFEVYTPGIDVDARLTAMSARRVTGIGDHAFITGFVIQGTGHKLLLIRALSTPTSTAGVPGLADPRLTLFNSRGDRIAANDDGPSSLASLILRADGVPSPAGSKDAALLVSLPAGAYTAFVTDAMGTSGEGIIYLHEVP